MSFNKLDAFTQKVADAADQIVGNPTAAKAIFDAAPEQLRTYFNNLIDALKSTSDTDSGAKNLGAKAITGLTGTDVQSLLEDLTAKTYQASPNIQIPTYFNGWVENSVGSGFYWKDKDNTVHFQLVLKNGDTHTNATIMTFPSGYIPDREYLLVGYCEGANVTDHTVIYHITNSPAGELKLMRDIGGNSLLILSGSFKAVS
jgi:hypothetical protein